MTTIITDRERAKDALIESLSREVESLVARLAAPPAQPIETLPLDYLRGFRDGLEWAADLAEAEDPRTSDWMYDDRNDLAEAIRRGPEMPPAQPAQRLSFVQATAPREIWLQVSDEADDNKEAFPDDHEGITWCQDSALMCEVKYVRADLAAQPAQAQPARLSDERIDEIASAMFYADEPMDSMARAFRPQWLESIARPLAHAIAAAVVPQGFVVVPEEPTEAMIAAYLTANLGYWQRTDRLPTPPDKWRTGTPSEATAESYRAMIEAAKATK